MKTVKKLLVSFLCLFLVLALNLPFTAFITAKETVYREEKVINTEKTCAFEDVPEVLDNRYIKEYGLTARNHKEETDLNTMVFKNTVGNNVMFTYSFPVKYVENDGKIYDKSNKIISLENNEKYQYTNRDNDIKTFFSKKIGDGVTITDGEYSITTIPLGMKKYDSSPDKSTYNEQDAIVYEDVFGDKTQLVYVVTYNGYKEEIVLSEYYGVNSFSFIVYTNGLDIKESWTGELYLTDENERFVANIGGQYVITADEANNTFADLSVDVMKKHDEYLLTVKLDEEYLKSEKTKYPIRIDPSVSFSGSNSVEDVTICSNSPSSPNSNSLYVGKGSTSGTLRTLMKFPNFNDLEVNSAQIIRAEVSIRDLMCESYSMDIYCHDFNSSWDVNTVQWSDCASFDSNAARMCKKRTISYSKGQGLSTVHRYTYDITALAKEWLDDSDSMNRGIIFKASDDFEVNGVAGRYRTFCSSNRSNYSNYYPCLTVEYTNGIPEGIYSMVGLGRYRALTTSRDSLEQSVLSNVLFNEIDEKCGDHLWHIGKNTDGTYTFTSIGQKPKACNGTMEYVLGNFGETAVLTVEESSNTRWSAEIIDYSNNGFFYVLFTNSGTSKKMSMDAQGNISFGDTGTVMKLNYIETYTFSDFWDGTYNVGIYDGVAHIKYIVDESIATSNFFSDTSVCDFSIVKDAWNGITEHIVIYGPNDTVPAGITPFVVTFKAEDMVHPNPLLSYKDTYGITNGIINGEKGTANQNWDSAVIILNDNEVTHINFPNGNPDYSELVYYSPFVLLSGEKFQTEFNATIIHEFGHALKLSHPWENHQEFNHSFADARGGIQEDTFCSVMGETIFTEVNNVYFEGRYGTQIVTKYDKINIISKWDYHSQCS